MRVAGQKGTDFNRAGNLACHVEDVTLEGAEAERGDGGSCNMSCNNGHGADAHGAGRTVLDLQRVGEERADSDL